MDIPVKLRLAYKTILFDEKTAVRQRTAREVLGASVIRVFRKGTRPHLISCLERVKIDGVLALSNEAAFRNWFERELEKVARVIRRHNPNRPQIEPGYKWGHASKILCLYCRDMVLRTRYFSEKDAVRISPWLYVPIDGIVIRQLRECGVALCFRQIREIDRREKFFALQDLLGAAAAEFGKPRVLFDDLWMKNR
ncbi:MAG: hypothetical protein AMXMBFR82_16380 [Candidatus Hydrogenedentota bacterium]